VQIFIRFFEESDASALQQAARESTREVYPWLPWCHPGHSLDDARSWISTQVEARVCGAAFAFVIISQSGEFLGGCGLNHINETDRRANLGYWVRTSAAGQGVATAGVRALSTWAFTNTQVERLEIVAAAGNIRSQRVAEKARAAREGVARSRLRLHEKFHDAVVYSIIRPSTPDA
jgi:RimJ/RimL family protein N-acetyltransferase